MSAAADTLRNWYDDDRPTAAFDLDGTVIDDAFPGYGSPRPDMVRLMRRLHRDGWRILITTSRPHPYHERIAEHLRHYAIPFDHVFTAAKPNADLYVDDRGLLPPAHALDAYAEFRRFAAHHVDPAAALGSGAHRSAWAVEQDAVPENPEAADVTAPGYVVLIPMTGGMDSTTLWGMAVETGVPYELVYVDVGQEYADAELGAIADVTDGEPVTVIRGHVPERRWRHIIPGRNATILTLLAHHMGDRWGEVWFGNLAGESPVVGGDKSARFLTTMQHLMTLGGHDIRLASPVGTWTKADEVRWWAARGRLDTLRRTKTCFAAHARQCGRCQACFRKWVGFAAAGYDPAGMYPDGVDFAEHVAKYRRVMVDPATAHRYSPARIADTLAACNLLAPTTVEV